MEYKFKFVLENKDGKKVITQAYTLDEICQSSDIYDKVYVDLGEKYVCDGNCTNESNSFCECEGVFDDYEITHKLMWTGLKDKKGVEIYESDLVNWKGMEYGDTQSYPEDLIDTVGEIECCYGSNEWLRNSPNQCEVIGNIHENPELLK